MPYTQPNLVVYFPQIVTWLPEPIPKLVNATESVNFVYWIKCDKSNIHGALFFPTSILAKA